LQGYTLVVTQALLSQLNGIKLAISDQCDCVQAYTLDNLVCCWIQCYSAWKGVATGFMKGLVRIKTRILRTETENMQDRKVAVQRIVVEKTLDNLAFKSVLFGDDSLETG
jgi:hypothetical protein